ncbi:MULTISPECIES: hypothetical protein [unclassified Kitasatospora]|uniref:hypothetical protein n=1 Tax=unclassified Kitasatospora TaxID=2633591 RepID=UPI00341C1A66
MRANHATKPQEPAPRGVGARRAIGRWLPRVLAAGGALLAQLGGFGAQGASADPLPDQTRPAVRRTLAGGPPGRLVQAGRPAHDGPSTERSDAPGRPAAEETDRPSPGLAGELTGTVPDAGIDGATGTVGSVFQDRIRAGGLPLPGQRAAVPDAFAIASGLLDTVPAQGRPAETRASREGGPAELPATARSGAAGGRSAAPAATTRPSGAADAPPVQEATAPDGRSAAGPATSRDRTGATTAPPVGPGAPAQPPETLVLADTATVTAVGDGSATATAVLAPIAAGLLLTGAAMCKHRGLPRGH